MVRSTNCGDTTNSKLTEGVKWFRSMLASESKSFPASDALWVDVAAPRYMVLVKTISTRDDCEVRKWRTEDCRRWEA